MSRFIGAGLVILLALAGLLALLLASRNIFLAFDNVTVDFYFRPLPPVFSTGLLIAVLALGIYWFWHLKRSRTK